ncbi:DUF4249 domain-containing protein [Aureispira sp. CCB-QB1]|uniref:DUF4249 domain-containing protein n=1 Tax=Aureispira sp. CCB-QB1 TaxID=1313421 RepID=UPI000697C1A2|nr:DUF4249 domain-containing protein [Aureispira sp. CCB-QB1]
MKRISYICWVLIVFSACQKLENTIDIELETSDNSLVVECYLEAGKPYQLMLTETKSYFDITNICPFVRHALVVITQNGIKDTLVEAPYSGSGCSSIMPYWNTDSTRFFNYGSNTRCPFSANTEFVLEVWDTLNDRYVKASATALPAVPIKTFKAEFNKDSVAYCLLTCEDDLNTFNYYRMTLHKFSLSKKDPNALFNHVATNPYFDQVLYDQALFANGEIGHASNYDFYRTDTAIGTIYHISKAYYDYLETTRAAQSANLNPFVEPSKIATNIQNGYGIFTYLAYDRDTLYIPW